MPDQLPGIEQYRTRCERQAALLENLTKANSALTATVEELSQTINGLRGTIGELKETICELQGKLTRNSRNSSQPPSKDGFNKPHPRGRREKTGRKPGGQAGHAGTHMAVPHEPDEVRQHLPLKCLACPRLAECREKGNVLTCGEKRHGVNVVVSTKVTEHQSMEAVACPYGEALPAASFPGNIRAYVQYGDSVPVLVGLLNTYGAVSVNRIHVLLGSLTGVGLSTGTIASMTSQCASKVGGTLAVIREMLAKEGVVHFDGTGTDVNGKTIWAHNSSTAGLTCQAINAKRGQDGMEDNGVLPSFKGIGAHDCRGSYWKYPDITHAICCAHLLRELTWVEEFSPGHGWAPRFKSLPLAMRKAKERTTAREKTETSQCYALNPHFSLFLLLF